MNDRMKQPLPYLPPTARESQVAADRIGSIMGTIGRTRLTDAESLIEAARVMHGTLRLSELYEIVVRVVTALTEAEGAVLLLHRPRTHHPIIFKLWDRPRSAPCDLPEEEGREFIEWLEGRGDDANAPFAEPPPAAAAAVCAAVGADVSSQRWMPLVARRGTLGAIGIVTSAEYSGGRAGELFLPLAEQAAAALDNALLFRQTERQSLENRSLLEASRMLLSSQSLDEVLDAILDAMNNVLPYNAGGVFLVGSDGGVERIVDRGYHTDGDENLAPLELKARQGLVGWAAEHGEALIVEDVSTDERYQNARVETGSEMVVPIFAAGRLVGVFNLERDSRHAFGEADLDLVTAFAQHAGVAIERARAHAASLEQRHLKGELAVARTIQQTFLPNHNPEVAGFAIAGINIPSEEVGGDYYDFLEVDEDKIGIAIADVAGKGIPAALIMAAFRASLMAEIRNGYTLRNIMMKVNQLLCERNDQSRFVTAIYGILDTRNRIFSFSNAGHNPGILRRADGSVELLHDGGVALGLFADSHFDERAFGLAPGDVILLYTDGVTETVGRDGSLFEMERLTAILDAHATEEPSAIIEAVRDALAAFADPEAPVDDLTMVVVAVRA